MGKENILIAAVQVPFTRGGAEILVDRLRDELRSRDFNVDVVQLPFAVEPKELLIRNIVLWRNLDLSSFGGRRVDRVIATKFPSYMVSHPRKVVWLFHQHRQIYELYGGRFGDFTADPGDEALRRMIMEADARALSEAVSRFAISENVAGRLERYNRLDAEVLLPPLPLGQRYSSAPSEGYILSVGRLCSIKRIDLLIKALPEIRDTLRLKIVGRPDEPGIVRYLRSEIDKHHLWHRVEFLENVDDEALLALYARSFAVYYAPHDEDYGFVTLEALASSKPVVTASDSGGVLSFIRHEENGLVAEPHESAIAAAFNRLLLDRELYQRLCTAAAPVVPSWDEVVSRLVESDGEREHVVNA